jgi:hypothetical protein
MIRKGAELPAAMRRFGSDVPKSPGFGLVGDTRTWWDVEPTLLRLAFYGEDHF